MNNANHNRNLRMAPEEYAKKLWNWAPFNPCFSRGIRFSDIDGMAEVNNHFLIVEGKTITCEKVPLGQYNALYRMSKRSGFTVIYFEGRNETDNHPQEIYNWRILTPSGVKDYHNKEENIDHTEELKVLIKEWFDVAEADKTPTPLWQRS